MKRLEKDTGNTLVKKVIASGAALAITATLASCNNEQDESKVSSCVVPPPAFNSNMYQRSIASSINPMAVHRSIQESVAELRGKIYAKHPDVQQTGKISNYQIQSHEVAGAVEVVFHDDPSLGDRLFKPGAPTGQFKIEKETLLDDVGETVCYNEHDSKGKVYYLTPAADIAVDAMDLLGIKKPAHLISQPESPNPVK